MSINNQIKNISKKIKAYGLQMEVAKIDDVLVLHGKNLTPLPINSEWLSKKAKSDDDYENIVRNFIEISTYLSEGKISDTAWALTLDVFFHRDNFEASKKCMDYIMSLDNPSEYGWINFIILCERNEQYDLAIKVAKKAYEKHHTPKFGSLLIYELVQFGDKGEIVEITDQLSKFPSADFDERARHYVNSVAWESMINSGEFLLAKKLLQKICKGDHDFHPLINMAHCFMMEDNKKEALKYYRKAKKLYPDTFLDDFDDDRINLSEWITNTELWDMVRKEFE